MKKFVIFASAIGLLLPLPTAAAGLPDGTCKGRGMTVTTSGGSIVKYKYRGKEYAVKNLGGGAYKIGSAGRLKTSSPKGNKFRGVFSMGGHNTPATFTCK